LFVGEYQQIYGGNEIIQKSSFVKRIHNYLIINYFDIIAVKSVLRGHNWDK